MMPRLAGAILLLGLFATPACAQGTPPSPSTLYLHDLGYADMVLSRQEIPGVYEFGPLSTGLTKVTTTCISTTQQPFANDYHDFAAIGNGDGIDYGRLDNGHYPSDPATLMGGPFTLAQTPAPVLHWFFQTEPLGTAAAPATQLVWMPALVAEVTLGTHDPRAPDPFEVIHREIATGKATGMAAGPLTSSLGGSVSYAGSAPDGSSVYEFTVPLQFSGDPHVEGQALAIRVHIYLDDPLCALGDGHLMVPLLRPISNPSFPSRLEFATVDGPIRFEPTTTVVKDAILLNATVRDLWGAYDLLAITMEATGPDGPLAVETLSLRPMQNYGVFFVPPDPARGLWQVQLADGLQTGTYTFTLHAKTLQEDVELATSFTIHPSLKKEQPFPGPVVAAAALGLALLARRRYFS